MNQQVRPSGTNRERLYLFDTTLRDGAQTTGVDFSVEEKRRIATVLDDLGIDYIEGGYPGANATADRETGSCRAVAASAGEVIPAATAATAARTRVFPVLRMLYGSSRLGWAGRAGRLETRAALAQAIYYHV